MDGIIYFFLFISSLYLTEWQNNTSLLEGKTSQCCLSSSLQMGYVAYEQQTSATYWTKVVSALLAKTTLNAFNHVHNLRTQIKQLITLDHYS